MPLMELEDGPNELDLALFDYAETLNGIKWFIINSLREWSLKEMNNKAKEER